MIDIETIASFIAGAYVVIWATMIIGIGIKRTYKLILKKMEAKNE